MNTRYAVNRFLKTARNQFLGALAFSCCLAMSTTAQGQGCPSATISYGQQFICGGDGNTIVTLNGTPGGTFSSSAGLIVNPMTGTLNPAASSVGTYTVHYMIPAAGSCGAVDATADVTIMPRVTVTGKPNVAVCSNTQIDIGPFASSMPGATFMWTNDNTSIGLPASGTGNIGEFTSVNNTDQPQRANIAVYAMYTDNGVTCTSKPMRFAITISPIPAVDPISNMTICSGGTTSPYTITGPTTGSGVRYVWTADNTAIGIPKSGQNVIPAFTALNATGVPQTSTITVTPYYNSGARCAGAPTSFTITVNPSPAGTASFSYSGSPYCPSGTASPTFTGPTGGTFYAEPDGLSLAPGTGNVNTSLSKPGTYTVYYLYRNPSGCSFVNTTSITINNANVGISYASAAYCNGTVGMLYPTITGFQGGTFSAPAGLDINASTGAINLATSTGGDFNVSYTVNTPDCGAVLVQTMVRIIETPIADAVPNRVVCAGGNVPTINLTSTNIPLASFSWTNDNPAIGLAPSGDGDIPAFVATNNTNAPIDAFIRVTPRVLKNGVTCFGRTVVFRIRVNPVATVDAVGNQAVCQSAGATAPINFTNSTGSNVGMTYMWLNNNTGIGLPASGTGSIPSFNPSVGSANISVRVTNSYGCTSSPMGFAYNVNNCGTISTGTGSENGTSRTRPAAIAPVTETDNAIAINVAPNPARSQVTVTYKGGTTTLRVLDLNGNTLKTIRGFNSSNTVNLSELRPGNYVLQLVDERKNTVSQRNIIKM
ncbi:MAG: T9SS type A sorting domain-containing protein [Chitinophagaceae bacterium]|nr:MAG: T9SS type A sorting domain-containing protein [Chitinophagaceae bacterium]